MRKLFVMLALVATTSPILAADYPPPNRPALKAQRGAVYLVPPCVEAEFALVLTCASYAGTTNDPEAVPYIARTITPRLARPYPTMFRW